MWRVVWSGLWHFSGGDDRYVCSNGWMMIGGGKPKKLGANLLWCNWVNFWSQMKSSGTEPEAPRREAGSSWLDLCNGHNNNNITIISYGLLPCFIILFSWLLHEETHWLTKVLMYSTHFAQDIFRFCRGYTKCTVRNIKPNYCFVIHIKKLL
jgi:hypothetical protein